MRELQSLRVGVFDSGIGGLTVLREIHRQLPSESILYFADSARLPYGIRSRSSILQFVREILIWMTRQEVKMVIMACNTSSALALDLVRTEFNFPILGLILPGARAAVQIGKRIGVLATSATVSSNAYLHALREVERNIQAWQVPCPELVPLIEQNRLEDPYTLQVVTQYLEPLLAEKIDTLIYGCTHYRYLSKMIRKILPPSIAIIDPAQYVVSAAEQEMELLGIKNPSNPKATRFCVSGDPEKFALRSRSWLGYTPAVETTSLPRIIYHNDQGN